MLSSKELSKPPIPYNHGWRFQAHSHSALAPTPVVTGCCINSESDRTERERLSPLERCLKRPPLPDAFGLGVVTLEIIDVFKGGGGHNAQVLLVQVVSSSLPVLPRRGTILVAKLYDPLYFDDCRGSLNPFLCMDQYYTHEACAYTRLREYQGHEIPDYYGSYFIRVPLESDSASGRTSREVRMILIEHVSGMMMSDIEPDTFRQAVRQHIMKSIGYLESRMYQKNLWLLDLEPRNIMICSPGSDRPDVVFLDPTRALFNRRRDDRALLKLEYFLGDYVLPEVRWSDVKDKPFPFSDWIDWDWDGWLGAEFANTVAGITPELRALGYNG